MACGPTHRGLRRARAHFAANGLSGILGINGPGWTGKGAQNFVVPGRPKLAISRDQTLLRAVVMSKTSTRRRLLPPGPWARSYKDGSLKGLVAQTRAGSPPGNRPKEENRQGK